MLFERCEQLAIEAVRRGEIGAERLLDDDAPPGAVVLARKPRLAEPGADRGESRRGRRKIEQTVMFSIARLLDALELGLQPFVRLRAIRFACEIGHAGEQLLGNGGIHRLGCELAKALFQMAAEIVGGLRRAPDPDDRETVRQQTRRGEIVKGGNEQPAGEIAGGAEDHEAARVRYTCSSRGGIRRHGCAVLSGSIWPPKPWRMAERTCSAKLLSSDFNLPLAMKPRARKSGQTDRP